MCIQARVNNRGMSASWGGWCGLGDATPLQNQA